MVKNVNPCFQMPMMVSLNFLFCLKPMSNPLYCRREVKKPDNIHNLGAGIKSFFTCFFY